jgi:hypothetical protein
MIQISQKYPTLIKGSIGEKAVDLIRSLLPQGSSILEFGCGVTTKLLLNWYNVYSIEHNMDWLNHPNAYHVSLKQYNDTDFKTPEDISCLPFYEKQVAWYDPDKLSSVLKLVPKYDLIIIDGPNGNYGRGGFYTHLNLFNTDTHMVFHDLNRQAEMELIKKVSAKVGRPAFILDDDDKTGVIKSNN